jgi:hypothetical protein
MTAILVVHNIPPFLVLFYLSAPDLIFKLPVSEMQRLTNILKLAVQIGCSGPLRHNPLLSTSPRPYSTTTSSPKSSKPSQPSQNKPEELTNRQTQKKTMTQLDEELRQKLEGMSGDGGAAGLELEDGKPVAMKRGVRDNMFRLI